jgi:hypothetical protein
MMNVTRGELIFFLVWIGILAAIGMDGQSLWFCAAGMSCGKFLVETVFGPWLARKMGCE